MKQLISKASNWYRDGLPPGANCRFSDQLSEADVL